MQIEDCASVVVGLCNNILLNENTVALPQLGVQDWEEILHFASGQGVLPVVVQALESLKSEGNMELNLLKVKWCGVSLQSQQGYHLRVEVMKRLAKLFASEGIDIMFLKGASLAQLYPKPEWRVFSDIDYYLFEESDKGIALMDRKGIKNDDYYHHHTQASYCGVLIENHYDFVERVNHKCDIILDDALKNLALKEGHSYKADFLDEDVKNAYLMTPTMNAIFLMRHMSAHFASETVTLRMLYDWALFLENQGSEVDWVRVCELYEQSGMMRFASVVQGLLGSHLGYESGCCPVPKSEQKEVEKVWHSILRPPKQDPYDKFTIRFFLFEARTFMANSWKRKMVYPRESSMLLFFKYARHGIKRKL